MSVENPEPTNQDAVDQPSPKQVEVRRNVLLAALVGGFAALLAVAFAVRAFDDGTALDWLSFGVLAVVTIVYAAALVDSRAPLLIADEHGVRLRHGARWQGISWPEIDCLEHLPRRGLFRDGHILVDGYDDQQLVVPLTLATRVIGAGPAALGDVLAGLADGRADVVEVVPGLAEDPAPRTESVPSLGDLYGDDAPTPRPSAEPDARPDARADDPADVERTDEILLNADPSEHAAEHDNPVEDDPVDDDPTDQLRAMDAGPGAERDTVVAARAEFDRPVIVTSPVASVASLAPDPHTTAGPSASASETSTVVLDDLAVRPAARPMVGPQLAAARDRLRLTIDQLSERTRIRPHVIESIEVDDFGPCGGDFYARGHLRTLARVLGIDAGPLVAAYDETYADAPVDPRRVFESELATGSGGAIRSTRGGRNWSVLVAAVMGAVLVWSVARLVMGGAEPVGDTPVLNQSGGISSAAAAKGDPVKLTLIAAGGGAELVVRDAAGEIVFDGDLAFGQTSVLKVVAPVRIWTSDGSVTYSLGKGDAKALGETGTEVSKTLIQPK